MIIYVHSKHFFVFLSQTSMSFKYPKHKVQNSFHCNCYVIKYLQSKVLWKYLSSLLPLVSKWLWASDISAKNVESLNGKERGSVTYFVEEISHCWWMETDLNRKTIYLMLVKMWCQTSYCLSHLIVYYQFDSSVVKNWHYI